MEAFEQVVKVYLEDRGYIVTSGAKFPVPKEIVKKSGRREVQVHGYEVDLVAARFESLLLASIKSFFGSAGVGKQGFVGISDPSRRTHFSRYTMFNDPVVRDGIVREASKRYGYPPERIRMGLFVGKFYRPDETIVRQHLAGICLPGGPVEVVALADLVTTLLDVSRRKTYINDAVVMTLRVLRAAGLLNETTKAEDAVNAERLDEFEDETVDEDTR